MTLSKDARLENLEYALRLFMEVLGSESVQDHYSTRSIRGIEEIFPTTWTALLKRGWLDPDRTHQTDSGDFLSFSPLVPTPHPPLRVSLSLWERDAPKTGR